MLKKILVSLFVWLELGCFAQQQITQYEYWFDDSYLVKTGTIITPVTSFDLDTYVPANLLTAGLHTFHIRFKDNSGLWSTVNNQFFIKTPATSGQDKQITGYEYWFDNDNANIVSQTLSSGESISLNTSIGVNSLTAGLHTFHIRFRDNNGLWSAVTNQFFMKPELPLSITNSITAYRYWFNNEFNKQITSVFEPVNPYIIDNLLIPVSDNIKLSPDNYKFTPDPVKGITITYNTPTLFNIQFKDFEGQWSSVSVDTIYGFAVHVTCDTLKSEVPVVRQLPLTDTIHFYMIEALAGDSLVFQSDKSLVIDLFDSYGKKLKTIEASESTAANVLRPKLDGTYYALVHGFGGITGNYTLTYTHIAKYAILGYSPKKIGEEGISLLSFMGNGFNPYTKVFLRSATTIIFPYKISSKGLSELNALIDFSNAPVGSYDITINFGDTAIVIRDGLLVEKSKLTELDVSILGPDAFGPHIPQTFTILVENKGNATAYNVLLGLKIKYYRADAIKDIRLDGNIERPTLPDDIDYSSLSQTEFNTLKAFYDNFSDRQHFISFYDFETQAYYLNNYFLIPFVSPGSNYTMIITILSESDIEISATVPSFMEYVSGEFSIKGMSKKDCCIHKGMLCVMNIILTAVTAIFPEVGGIIDHVIECTLSILLNGTPYLYPSCYDTGVKDIDQKFDVKSLTSRVINALLHCLDVKFTWDKIAKIPFWTLFSDTYEMAKTCVDFAESYKSGDCKEIPPRTPKKRSRMVASYDPNDKIGYRSPSGSRYFSASKSNFTYVINFENLKLATAPAREVYITDTLDLDVFDINSFKAGYIKIGNRFIQAPYDAQEYKWVVDMRPEMFLRTEVNLTLDKSTGIARWYFKSIDPMTESLPTDALTGFLPPNDSTGSGQGSVSYSINLKDGIEDGTNINNQASIVFDYNEPVNTPIWNNIKDYIPPVSTMNQPVIVVDTIASLSWQAQDNFGGSGLWYYNLYSKKKNEEYSVLLSQTKLSEMNFNFEWDTEYYFYVSATDSAGNTEVKTVLPEVTLFKATPGIRLSSDTIKIAKYEGSTAYVDITSNTTWTINTGASWLNINPSAGSNNQKITFTAKANPTDTVRTASVTISATGVGDKIITVKQDAGPVTDIIDNPKERIKLYPNPAANSFRITGFEDQATLTLLDLTGRVHLIKEVTTNEEVSIRSLPPGMYILRLSNEVFTVELKLTKE